MKKVLSIAVSALAAAAFAGVPTSTTIGVTKINTKLKSTVVAVPYVSLADGGAVAAGHLVKAANLPDGTMLYTFVDGAYGAYVKDGTAWSALKNAGSVDGVPYDVNPPETLQNGSAVWVVLPSAPDQSAGQDIVIYGQAAAQVPQTIKGDSEKAVASLVANPLQEAKAIPAAAAPAKGDMIRIPGDDQIVKYAYTKRASDAACSWYDMKTFTKVDALPPVGAGCGFWYIRAAGAGDTTIEW